MEWRDCGIVLSVRPHGESSALLELLTRVHGRHMGLVRGGRSRRLRASLQPGNSLDVVWRARLEEHLGVWSVELRESRAALLMAQELSLTAMMSAAGVCRLLPERDVCRAVYDGLENLLGGIISGDLDCWARYVSWELELLRELGYGLDGKVNVEDVVAGLHLSGERLERHGESKLPRARLRLEELLRRRLENSPKRRPGEIPSP
ncbi:MAG: DNA repair protein RecO [Hyphomicrobiales bacterium]|nr:DNA repair protein RecO [Hyphomicrobiales bacterium]